MAATVSATAKRFAHVPRPKRLTAVNPTATRNTVTLFGVQLELKIPAIALFQLSGSANWPPMSGRVTGLLSGTYGKGSAGNKSVAPAVSVRCMAFAAAGEAANSERFVGQFVGAFRSCSPLATKSRAASSQTIRGFFVHAC